jgi:hypothetical protein
MMNSNCTAEICSGELASGISSSGLRNWYLASWATDLRRPTGCQLSDSTRKHGVPQTAKLAGAASARLASLCACPG